MKLIRAKLTVTVTEVEDHGHQPKDGCKPEGFMVGSVYFVDDDAPSGAIDRVVQRMVAEVMPSAYAESEKRWAD